MTILYAIFLLIFLTFLPGLEARASIPFAFFHQDIRLALGLPFALLLCGISNIIVGFITFYLMQPVVLTLRKWGWFERKIWPFFQRAQLKLAPYIERYGELGLAIFIGIPLPGTGAYTGAVGAFLLGMKKRHFWIANIFGVLIACIIITVICTLIDQGIVAEESIIRKIFVKQIN